MKIVAVDNLDRETVDDKLIAENVDERHGKIMTQSLNDKLCTHEHAPWFFRLVDDSYTLKSWEP